MGAGKTKRTLSSLFWGRMEDVKLPARIVGLVFVMAAIASMSFCQIGFLPFGVIDGKSVYLLLVLAPLVMGAFMFGPLMGLLLGLYTGIVVFFHSVILPLDFYEAFFLTPFNSFVLITLIGAVAGLLIHFVFRRDLKNGARFALIVLMCFVLSFFASLSLMGGVVLEFGNQVGFDTIRDNLFSSVQGVIVQATIDALAMVLLCCAAEIGMRKVAVAGGDRPLLSMFRNWMLAISAIVFMLASAFIFSMATKQAQDEAEANMVGEAAFLAELADSLDESNYNTLLEGYRVRLDGYFVIMDEQGTILATNSKYWFSVGESFIESIGYDDEASYHAIGDGDDNSVALVAARKFMSSIAGQGKAYEIQSMNENGEMSLGFSFLAVDRYDGGYTAVFRMADMVYGNRFYTMLAMTLVAILLIGSVSILATIVLKRLVVRRIGETNESLGKITNGNLDEHVKVRDSREFLSLSRGINTTVSVLKDTILEVEQRNAQDLATAKAIQESALPREFPPFPDIDRFDIYASMKMAKEVGGDFYDFFLIEDDSEDASKLGFVIADVSGKGIPAALFMMTAKTQIRNYMEAGLSVDEAVNAANHQLCIGNDTTMFVTAWIGVLDYSTGVLSYVNAGHNPPLLLHDGDWEWVKDRSGMPLGLIDATTYRCYERQLSVGDMLYSYTDGVTEAMDADGNLFGEDRLVDTLRAYAHFNPRSVGVGVRRAITDYTLDCEQSDDITMLVLKYGVPPEKKAVMVLRAEDEQLVHVCNFIHEELKRRNAPKAVYNPLDLAAEELFINVCHYAYPDATPEKPGEARISFEYEANPPSLTVGIADDGIPYDPLSKPDTVLPDNIEDMPTSGFGLIVAKHSVDGMAYERVDGSNVLTFRKEW